ncbi:collagen alpha-1(III) chain [Denticeps clupeoides]|uniref:collagen alpha-1(III) chain n=1 Tax=Denticeps clupeoides TaxID=299321 RepID=UPI0010A2D7FB|nr:collagen alpha-1(III) chain-like [Denticeps clupeoides]
MLSRNLLVASVVVLLATTASTAPVEEKERDESEVEAEEGEEELSEEEEDDDDSKSQDMNEGTGVQQATTVSRHPGQKNNGDGAVQSGSDSSSSSSAASGVHGDDGRGPSSHSSEPSSHDTTSSLEAGFPGASDPVPGHHDSAGHAGGDAAFGHSAGHGQPGPPASDPHAGVSQPDPNGETMRDGPQTQAPGAEPVGMEPPETEDNGNGNKHLAGGAVTGQAGPDHFREEPIQTDPTGAIDSFGSSQLDLTGVVDPSSADFILGLMGGMDAFGPDAHTDALGPPEPSGQDQAGQERPRPDHTGLDHSALDYWPDGPGPSSSSTGAAEHIQIGFPADTTDVAFLAEISHTEHSILDRPGGMDMASADAPETNGNGRHKPHKPVTQTQQEDAPSPQLDSLGLTDQQTAAADALATGEPHGVASQRDQTGAETAAGESVTSAHIQVEVTALGDVYGSRPPGTMGAVTDGQPRVTDMPPDGSHGFTGMFHGAFTQTEHPVTDSPHGAFDHTGVVDAVTADLQGTVGVSSQPGVTEQTLPAVSAGEQYNTSGQGPQGAENVELEDTC